MSGDLVIQLAQQALMTVMLVAAPMLGLGLIVGLMVSVFQATTSIHEQTLAFIPKIIAVCCNSIFWPMDAQDNGQFCYGDFC